MAVKKSELYPSLWASCDSLRGGMDSSLALIGNKNIGEEMDNG